MNALERKQELLDAVKQNDISRLESLLPDEAHVNAIFPNGKTLLTVAIERQNEEIVEFLVQAGADLNQRDFYDRTPLMYASDKEKVSVAQLLLDAGADVNAKNKQGRTALMYAAYKDHLELAEVLLNTGADINARDRKDRSALNYSVYKKGRNCHNLLTARGAEVREPRTNKSNAGFLKKILSTDEFTELKQHSNWTCSEIIVYSVLTLSVSMSSLVLDWGVFVRSLLVILVVWALLLGFPSLLKIFPLAREIIWVRSPQSSGVQLSPSSSHPSFDDYDDLAFVSHLMDLGSKELTTIHLTKPISHSLTSRISIFYSRVASVLLAVSVLVLSVVFLLFLSSVISVLIGIVLLLWRLIVGRLEYRLRLQRLRWVQKDRDRIAGEISKLLNAEDFRERELPPDFGLYLRAFMTTDKLHIKGFDLETMLAYSIAPTLPLLALGRPGEHLGSGRIRTLNEYWQEEIVRLMDGARLILIIPSHREGTLWEIATLRERGYFEKTIFIMPPELKFHGDQYSGDWQKTVRAARERGLEFPNHIAIGALFRLNGEGEFEEFAPFLPDEFLEELDPRGRGSGSDDSNIDSTDGDDDSADIDTGMDVDSGDSGDGGLGADVVDSGGDGGFGGDGGGGDGGGDGGGG